MENDKIILISLLHPTGNILIELFNINKPYSNLTTCLNLLNYKNNPSK